ncbi:MAG: PQQ-dependent sugar dehydrogenase, partial [Armatimonadota bacterium]|nr:PQQ-dependent sugar dehydrogenase [Armatimonadota bacterium]
MKRILSLPLRFALAAGMAATLAACQNARHPVEAAPKPAALPSALPSPLLTGQDALGDWLTDAPGVRRRLTVADLPTPYATPSVDNGAHMVGRPEGAMPKAPAGFAVEQFATDLANPRRMITAPNGDIFVSESGANRVKILRAADGAVKPDAVSIFADGLRQPFGLALYPLGPNPQWLYVANTDSVVRFPYKNGDLKAAGAEETIVPDLPGGGRLRGGGHWTRDIVFSKGGKKMFVSVGSHSNVNDDADEFHRADILEFNPDGTGLRVYASGIRNPVGIAINPQTGTLWTSVNERDALGDFL